MEELRDQLNLCNLKKVVLDDKTTLECLINLLIEQGILKKEDIENGVNIIRSRPWYDEQYSDINGEKILIDALIDEEIGEKLEEMDKETRDPFLDDDETKNDENKKTPEKKGGLFSIFKKKPPVNLDTNFSRALKKALANYKLKYEEAENKTLYIAVIGSSILKEEILEVCRDIELTGNIPLVSHVFSHADKYDDALIDFEFVLDLNAFKRIEQADIVLVVEDFYIGDSTMDEIKTASILKKEIWVYDINTDIRFYDAKVEAIYKPIETAIKEAGVDSTITQIK